MHRLLFTIFLLASLAASAQEYAYPLVGVRGQHSASFGEMRENHFHSGIDIKTDGVEGKPVVAVADGYVSRVSLSPSGYGLALYITHPQRGTTSVYGHLSRLRDDLRDRLTAERYAGRKNRINLYFKPSEFPVGRGETVAWSGNSGTSFGPHLHFEISDTKSQRTLNTVARGLFRPSDRIAPRILRLHYVEIDSVGRVAAAAPLRSWDVRKEGAKYAAAGRVEIGRCGYFVLEVRDSRDSVANRFGVYRVCETVDGGKRYEYSMDGFSFADSRYCNAVSYFPLQVGAKCEAIRLAQPERCPERFFTVVRERGIVRAAEGETRSVRIEVEDDCGNMSVLEFDAVGKADDRLFVAERNDSLPVLDCSRRNTVECGDVTLSVPAGALYESAYCRIGRSETPPRVDSTLVVLSPVYRIMDDRTPVHSSVNISIRADVPLPLQRKACIAVANRKGRFGYLGGFCSAGGVMAESRRFGDMVVVADTVAPRIRPRWKDGADLRSAKSVRFAISDNFSGIKDYECLIDGKWRTLDYSPLRGTIEHRFDVPLPSCGAEHEIVIRAEDCCGNRAEWRGRFVR